MLTSMDSPTSTSNNSSCRVLASCSHQAAEAGSTLEQQREPVSPSKQDLSCAKHPSSKSKHLHRHSPYDVSARSPGSCSSDGGDSVQSDADNQDPVARVHSKVKRKAANSRERKRMHTVNSAFDQLRELVPTYPSNRKLSKIDTLRLACTYIQDLVSLLHNSQAIQGEDVLYTQPPPFPDTFSGYPVTVKQELTDFQPFPTHEHFRMQPAAACVARFPNETCPDTFANGTSEPDSSAAQSPPHHFMPPQIAVPPPQGTARPPPLTRVTSEGTATIHPRISEATMSSGTQSPPGSCAAPLSLPPPQPATAHTAQTSMYNQPPPQPQQRQVNITSPLAMHTVHHSSTSSLLHGGLRHHSPPPPVWQRPTMSSGFPVYGQ